LIETLSKDYDVIVLASDNGRKDKLEACGAMVLPVEMERHGTNPLKEMKLVSYYKKQMREINPRIVLTYTIKPNIYGAFAAKLLGIPNSCMMAGLGYAFSHDDMSSRIARALYRLSMKCTQHIMVLNESNYNTLQEKRLCKREKILWLKGGEGVNISNYPFYDNDAQEITFVFIARMIAEKGYRIFVEAAKEVKKQYSQVKFHAIGTFADGSPDASSNITKEEVENDVKQGYIEYLGTFSNMLEVYSRPGSVITIPSYYSEGLNRSLMEACSCGKPIITTSIYGCKETVVDGVNGYLVEPKSVPALVDAIKRYIELSQEQRRQMSIESRKLAESRFDIKKVIAVYDDIIAHAKGS
jgi:glycosyltransferase involved in cell wall biosynthesis